jgi:uncharacterized protein (TIGR02996 family)
MLLRQVFSRPEDEQTRMVYADWLEERSDPRAAYVRLDPRLGRPSGVEWLLAQEWYDPRHDEPRVADPLRQHRRELASGLDPAWVALFDVLACPFESFGFFHGPEHPVLLPQEIPFAEVLGTRGPVVTFASSLRGDGDGLAQDLQLLLGLELGDCAYGAQSCPVHPFLCDVRAGPLTEEHVLEALHVPRLTRGEGAYGYFVDRIHRDFLEQPLFQRYVTDEEGDDTEEPLSPEVGTHGALQRYVRGGELWYVLLHTPSLDPEYERGHYVVLLAVGASPTGDRLLGVVSHQVCHNLCD